MRQVSTSEHRPAVGLRRRLGSPAGRGSRERGGGVQGSCTLSVDPGVGSFRVLVGGSFRAARTARELGFEIEFDWPCSYCCWPLRFDFGSLVKARPGFALALVWSALHTGSTCIMHSSSE